MDLYYSDYSKYKYNKEVADIKVKNDAFILRATSKKFKQLYSIEYGSYISIIKGKISYDILYRKVLQAIEFCKDK